jgi:hypothetical protein
MFFSNGKVNAGQATNLLERARKLINKPVGSVADTPQDLPPQRKTLKERGTEVGTAGGLVLL